jgi:hypothetical protein
MDRPALMAITVAFLLLLLVLMYLGWRARQRRQLNVPAPLAAPAELGAQFGTFGGKYVATTTAGDPLDRIAVHGLGFRSAVALTVTSTGVLVQRPGSIDVWIPRDDIVDRRTATWTIDRVVEHDGLDLLQWNLGGTPVESYFRLLEPDAFEAAFQQLFPKKAAA